MIAGANRRALAYERPRAIRFLMQVVWPAFATAALTCGLVFSALDPMSLHLFGHAWSGTREGAYTAGFLLFWLLHVGACSVTWWITRTDAQRAARRGFPEERP